ncbi:hypothetical protein [Enteractinococcus helveticum]|uniref:Major facilitator superfamily (MFS) profile domain-containing protein n=1 Tax=Enteractinococcus helveticum TaxID=1837282 RepID=A0A1B7LW40_9MICC|nr:hypothetical protein [Enteractinococcus helveticum]OAV59230.1 hypothetical protein A6F49_15245 [Enteractinococcus helveticum]
MSRISMATGVILIVLGGLAYALTAFASWTALIPALIGLLFIVCSLIGFINQTIGAVLGIILAIVGIVGTGMNALDLGAVYTGASERPAAVITSAITCVLLIAYVVVVMIRGLINAYRKSIALPQ